MAVAFYRRSHSCSGAGVDNVLCPPRPSRGMQSGLWWTSASGYRRHILREQVAITDRRSHSALRASGGRLEGSWFCPLRILARRPVFTLWDSGLHWIVKGFGFSPFKIGLLVAIPNLIAVLGMVFWARNSDRTGERYWHAAFGMSHRCLGDGYHGSSRFFSRCRYRRSPPSLRAGRQRRQAAVVELTDRVFRWWRGRSIALINSLGTLGGFIGPYMIGSSGQNSGHFGRGLYWVALYAHLIGCNNRCFATCQKGVSGQNNHDSKGVFLCLAL